MNFDFATILAAAAPPAGGAAIGQVVIATAAATIVTAALLYLGLGHRSGRVQILQRLADHSRARLRPARLGRASRRPSPPSRC